MRLASLAVLLGASALGAAQAASSVSDDFEAEKVKTFDGKPVAPLVALTADNFDEEVKKSKYLIVKFYSPYCPHCLAFAPTYETLYAFYHTSTAPADADATAPSTKSFEKYYDFRFAELNCIAYGDLCTKNNIQSYPQTILYKDAKQVDSVKGGKNISAISTLIEDQLEKDFPGTRPKELLLPAPGDVQRPSPTPKSPEAGKDGPVIKKVTPGVHSTKSDKSAPGQTKEVEASKGAGKAKSDGTAQSDGTGQSDGKAKEPEKAQSPKVPDASSSKVVGSKPANAPDASSPKAVASKPAKATKPKATANLKGLSVSLTAESFQALVTTTQDPWFIKFYAPWCHHCQAMASNWQQLAKDMQGKLNIGEVNCDAESRLCKEVRLRGYPTILFFKGGERVEYDGLRGIGDLVKYAEKALDISQGVVEVDAKSFKAMEEKEDVIFVYFFDHATTTEDMMALERLPLSLIGHAKLVKTKDPELAKRFKITTWPRLLASREGRPTYYTPLAPNQMRDIRSILTWMQSVWLPIVPELTASNARDIMDGKIVVLGILNREDNDSFLGAKREMKSAATEWMDKQIVKFQMERQNLRDSKQLRIEEAEDRNDQRALRTAKSIRINMDMAEQKEVMFAWVDGVFWQRWVRTTYGIDVKDGERVIINDEDNRRYWDTTSTGNYIIPSRTSILETIPKVIASPPQIKPKMTISSLEKLFFDLRIAFSEHPFLTLACIAALGLLGGSWFRGRLRRSRPMMDTLPIRELKEGLLSNTANGKKD